MPSLPRIITVDPTGNVARIVRAAIDLSNYACRQIDVPSGEEALSELRLTESTLVISALNLEDMRAFDLAEQAQELKEDLGIVVLADIDDPEMDLETQQDYGFVYLQRPLEIEQFSRVLFTGMRGDNLFAALQKPKVDKSANDMGPVPKLNLDKAQDIITRLVSELSAMSILLIDRSGNVLLERGPSADYIDPNALGSAMIPSMQATIDMRDIVGGEATTLQFFDGDHRDIYVLSVGLHHMVCIAFDGENGQRQFGAVNRYGRRAAMDLIALLGADAFFVQRSKPEPEEEETPLRKRSTRAMPAVEEEEETKLAPAEGFEDFEAGGNDLEKVEFDQIPDDAFDASFLDQLDDLDENEADALFNPDALEKTAANLKSQRTLSEEEALQLGILGKNLEGDGQ